MKALQRQDSIDDGGLFAGAIVNATLEAIHSGNRFSWSGPRLGRACDYHGGYRRFSTHEKRIDGGSCQSSDGYAQP
jgi:hypothetical protein